MAQMVLGIFPDRANAESALSDLQSRGYNPSDISIIVKEGVVKVDEASDRPIAEGTVSGATTGGIIGAVAGLLTGIGAIVIPGFGGILIGGPIAAALGLTGAAATTVSGAITGALAGGVVGGLISLGIPEREARVYEEELQRGAILLAVPTTDIHDEEMVTDILRTHGATQVNTVDSNVTR